MTDLRLIAYAANGASLGPLPNPSSIQVSYVLNDQGGRVYASHPADAMRQTYNGQ